PRSLDASGSVPDRCPWGKRDMAQAASLLRWCKQQAGATEREAIATPRASRRAWTLPRRAILGGMKRLRSTSRDRWLGIALVLISAIAFGATAIFARFAYADGVDVPTLLFLRFTLAGMLLLALLVARRLPVPRGRVLAGLLLLGAVGRVGQGLTFFYALTLA